MSWLKKVWQNFRGVEDKKVRARTEEGKFVADDKSTPDVNEAWEGGKKPSKSKSS